MCAVFTGRHMCLEPGTSCEGCFFMYFQIETVLEKYDLEDARISKGRQVLLCEKNQKLYGLKEYFGTEKKAQFLYRLGQYLRENGFVMDGLIKTREDALLAEGVDGIFYTLHHWYRGRECDIKSRMEIMMAVSALARFHRLCRGFPVGEHLYGTMEDPLQEYARHTKELKKIYRFVTKRKKKSEYEVLFLSCFQEFFKQCEEIQEQMEQRQLHLSSEAFHVCHGDFNHHNVLSVLGEPVFLHFEKAGYGLQIFDFCNFKRKVMEKYCWDESLGLEMLREYHRICPISEVEFWHMYYRLAYPEKFWKLADRYYVSNKAWISRQNYEKLEKELRQNPYRKQYMHRLLYFYENMERKK